MSSKLEAHYQNRTYYFVVTDKKQDEISISMYSTPYTFVKKEGKWINHSGNKLNMTEPLIEQVALASAI